MGTNMEGFSESLFLFYFPQFFPRSYLVERESEIIFHRALHISKSLYIPSVRFSIRLLQWCDSVPFFGNSVQYSVLGQNSTSFPLQLLEIEE